LNYFKLLILGLFIGRNFQCYQKWLKIKTNFTTHNKKKRVELACVMVLEKTLSVQTKGDSSFKKKKISERKVTKIWSVYCKYEIFYSIEAAFFFFYFFQWFGFFNLINFLNFSEIINQKKDSLKRFVISIYHEWIFYLFLITIIFTTFPRKTS